MMKELNPRYLISLLLLTSLLLTACSGAKEVADDSSDITATTESVVEKDPVDDTGDTVVPEKDAVVLTIWADSKLGGAIRAAEQSFESDFGVNLVIEEFGFGAILNNFVVAAPADEGPDVIVGAHDWLGELVTNGLLAPIDIGDKEADYVPSALQALTYNGELYGLPYMFENAALFRNTDLVPGAPTTWYEVIEISRELTANNSDNIEANQYGYVHAGNDAYHFFPLMTSYGGYVFGLNADNTYDPSDIGIDSPGTVEAAELLDSMFEEGLVPSNIDGQTITDWFTQGKAALTITGPWNLVRVRESGINYAIDPIPSGSTEGYPFLGVGGFMVSAFSENPLLAQIFVTEFVGTPDLMRAFYEAEPRPPAYLPVLNDLDDPDIEALAQAGRNALPMPSIPEMGSVWQSWINALTLITQQTIEPDKAFATAEKQITLAIESRMSSDDDSEDEPIVYDMVNIPGTAQTAMGCSGDWIPDCKVTALTLGDDGLWSGTFDIPAGEYEVKIACNGGWDINFGFDGRHNGSNIVFSLESDTSATFTFDPETSLLEITGEGVEVGEGTSF